VFVWRYVARGTIEERMLELQVGVGGTWASLGLVLVGQMRLGLDWFLLDFDHQPASCRSTQWCCFLPYAYRHMARVCLQPVAVCSCCWKY
jgi:hypothetical protein